MTARSRDYSSWQIEKQIPTRSKSGRPAKSLHIKESVGIATPHHHNAGFPWSLFLYGDIGTFAFPVSGNPPPEMFIRIALYWIWFSVPDRRKLTNPGLLQPAALGVAGVP
ncbi:MAG: hypothetical protein P8Y60_17525, partial [Calditrichota bacterium]